MLIFFDFSKILLFTVKLVSGDRMDISKFGYINYDCILFLTNILIKNSHIEILSVSLFFINGITTFWGYLMPNPPFYRTVVLLFNP